MNIYQKMSAITAEVAHIPKRGYNSFSNYKYVLAVDVINEVSKLLVKHGIYLSISETEFDRRECGKNYVSLVRCDADFIDIDDPEQKVRFTYNTVSADTLDKDIFKAKTNGLKYLFTQAFLIVTDNVIDSEDSKHEPASKQGGRPSQKQVDYLLTLLAKDGVDMTPEKLKWLNQEATKEQVAKRISELKAKLDD